MNRRVVSGQTLCNKHKLPPSINRLHNLLKAFQAGFDVLDDLGGEDVGVGEVVQICEAFVFQPEYVEVGLVAGDDLLVGEFSPSAFRGGFRPGFFAVVPVGGVVAVDEVLEVFQLHGVFLEGVVDIGSVIVYPHLFGPGVFGSGLVVEEQDVGFHAVGIEDAGGQAKDGVQIGGAHQLLAHGLSGAAFEEHVVGKHHGGLSVGFEEGADVLQEVELLVARGSPEILAVVAQVLLFLLAGFVGDGHAALLAERRIGQHVVCADAFVRYQGVVGRNKGFAVDLADVVQKHVHQAQPAGARHDLIARKGVVFQKSLLLAVQGMMRGDVIVSREEKPARAATGVVDFFVGLGGYAPHHGLDERARSEVLPGAALGVGGVLFQQAFVNIAFNIRAHHGPLLLADHVDDFEQLGRVLYLVLALGEYLPQDAFLAAQRAQHLGVIGFQFGPPLAAQHLPVAVFAVGQFTAFIVLQSRKPDVLMVGRFAHFVGHFQKQQVGDLLEVVSIAHAVIAKHVGEVPDFGDQ
jgi:hypothetical protein